MTTKKSKINASATLDSLNDNEDDIETEQTEETDDSAISKPYDPTQIRVDPRTFSLRNILDMIDDNDLDLAPDFQRMKVWSLRQKSRLIESVLLRIPLPAFYFSSDLEGYMQVVDGVQRLSTIHDFVRLNGFSLQHLEYLDRELGGKSYSDIEGTIWAKRINSTQITVNVIDPQTPTRVKFDIFKRINTGGTPLNAQEIRHCMSGKRTRDLLKRLTALKSFDRATGGRLSGHLRMADRELALRWVAFTLLGDIKKYGADDIATLEDLLNATTERLDLEPSIDMDDLVNRFDHAMILAHAVFGNHAFRKWELGSDYHKPLNKALFEAVSVPLAYYDLDSLKSRKKQIQNDYRTLCTNNRTFLGAISAGTSDPRKVRYRFEKINEILSASHQ